jgi:hypothetical protein
MKMNTFMTVETKTWNTKETMEEEIICQDIMEDG